MIVNAGYRGKVGAAVPKFTYTGQYNQRDDGVVELLTSGTLTFLHPAVIDVFCVGGGGSGGTRKSGDNGKVGYGGGAGGYTATIRKAQVSGNFNIIIGAGGQVATSSEITASLANGGTTSFGNLLSADGGGGHYFTESYKGRQLGQTGGSGGGGGVSANSYYGTGGSNGENGEQGYPSTIKGGNGQGATTREFGEATGKLYAGGGAGGRYMEANSPVVSTGGTGGGGNGAWVGNKTGAIQAATAGGANTGGGGGGGAHYTVGLNTLGASGGSGIVCFRTAK